MKRFHFATIHLIMIGLVLFGIATIFVRVLQTESALIFALFIIMVVVVALLHYQKTTYESLEIEQLDELNQDVEASLKTLLGRCLSESLLLTKMTILNGSTPMLS